MSKDQLFLLRADFSDARLGDTAFYCPSCAQIEGLLSFYSRLRQDLDIRYVDFPKPRAPIVALIGEDHQSCPVLVLGEAHTAEGARVSTATGRHFIAGSQAIAAYLAARYGIGVPHP
ncbi:DUF3088 domain-containing protein [Tahibacter amnicola]|uniref:DUF3088 domain-containing protein n=1 Tax=Tahibacter amnicola TaxID=2976241 RepID=A0ABY6BEX0_9GAMM|nr:DUF3088 domain-containing protein [Tahibacter amnicola]UXI67655.1 DUF3088 domain-containing protein [Tahibacter amnicola]